ncbi:Predicted hydrolases or acyltransferases (alpha/beta hydrolase superfamily) [Streptomyces sp. MnatMP-M77]|uniref:alpha/beta hydrolase n=1 Tax=unclassified Streptomyces TaxID=2593676 RepID=UPI00080577FC|nr:alpha/beta hydrolase [Streptomyces sp. MnatMP-M77]MYT79304.1 alpha/beta fold hydrolase [Streptomyces sp. SID8364]SBV03827.1 Predicted hydrolases or acyltransferases (alpha/beta hydrolase superfamily) [Streptomyces sp. MnatMP-M77]
MNRKSSVARSLALLAVLGLGASLTTAPVAAEETKTPQVKWGQCPDDVVAEAAPTVLQCATVPVPLDYAEPEGEQIDLTVSRLGATDPDKRRGVLMLNPGGPGGSGLALSALLVAQGLPRSVTNRYDLIGMDTRGIGHSTPVSCGFTTDGPYYSNIPPYAVDDDAVTVQAKVAEKSAEQCAENDDGRLRHLTTANTTRDLDRIRAALGEEKASYLGYSYGTALGAAYASMFPERSDRIVLDSNIGDTHLDRDGMRRYALGMEQTLPDFAKWAARRHDSYGLGHTPGHVRASYLTIAGRLDKAPIAGLDGSLFRLLTFGHLFKQTQYPTLAQTWRTLLEGDETAARGLTAATGEAADGLSPTDNALTVFLAVTCNDVEWPEDVNTYRQGVAEDRERYPLYGAATANITPCAFWPYAPAEPPVGVDTEGPRNVLLLQNRRDASTPHLGGKMLREKFGNRARLISVDDSGHGVYVLGKNSCALNTATRFLVAGEMPTKDTSCPAD